jgi:2',3'-cyclic-nucleotide 2'-phosphodiesterase (5'-nucleotidase family)
MRYVGQAVRRFRISHLSWALLALSLAVMGFRCDGKTKPSELAPARPTPDLRLVLLTDPKGYLEPCGCQMRPLGGIDKLATELTKARSGKAPVLVLAAGDLTFGSVLRPEDVKEAGQQEVWRAETLVDVWSSLKFAAVTPGPLDLNQAPDVRETVLKHSQFPWLAENLTGPNNAAFGRARVLEAGGIKVGVFGLLAPSPALHLPSDVTLDPKLGDVAHKTAEGLRAQGARIVIALLSGDRKSAREVADAGADLVVLGGVDQEKPLTPTVIDGKGIVVNAGYQGQRMVTLDLELDAAGEWHDASEWTLREAQTDLEHDVKELEQKIAAWSKDAKVKASDLDAQRTRLAALQAELKARSVPSYSGRWFAADVLELSPEVRGDPEIAKKIDDYDRRVNDWNRDHLKRPPLPAPEGAAHYVGSESCQGCHAEAYAWWKSTKHGRAYATLEKVHKEFNLSCVGCHVTGYNQPGGSTVTHVTNLKDVGCENCHGPGSLHSAAPEQAGLVARDTPEAVCVSCHNHEHSDRFVYEAFKPLLRAPGHGLPKAKVN